MSIPGISRRRALSGAATVGVSLPLLAACGGSNGAAADPPPSESVSSTPGDAPAEQGSSSSPAGAGGLTAVSDVPVGGGVIFPDDRVVVTQPTEGDFKAFTAVCTHTGCIVNEVTDTINCPCHGSMYDLATGAVVGGPAPAPLDEVSFSVKGAEIVLS